MGITDSHNQSADWSRNDRDKMPLLGDFLHGEGFDDIACPMKRGFMGTPDMTLFGGSEFRQSKVLLRKTLGRTCVRAQRRCAGRRPDRSVFRGGICRY